MGSVHESHTRRIAFAYKLNSPVRTYIPLPTNASICFHNFNRVKVGLHDYTCCKSLVSCNICQPLKINTPKTLHGMAQISKWVYIATPIAWQACVMQHLSPCITPKHMLHYIRMLHATCLIALTNAYLRKNCCIVHASCNTFTRKFLL